jgi:hypothetical protein
VNRANTFWSRGKGEVQIAYEVMIDATQATPRAADSGGSRRQRITTTLTSRVSLALHSTTQTSTPTDPACRIEKIAITGTSSASGQDRRPACRRIHWSPFRHGSSSQTQTPQQACSSPSFKSTPQRTPSSISVTHRQAVPASATAIATRMKYKATGTGMFELGRYGEASAIASKFNSRALIGSSYHP